MLLFFNLLLSNAGLSALIKMKKAAGRPKDIEDLKYLERLYRKQTNNDDKMT